MAKRTKTKTAKARTTVGKQEYDGVFLLKITLYLILGSMWLKVYHHNDLALPLPIGLAIGVFFALHDHFQIDRKIEYAVLLIATLVGFISPFGLYISF